MIFKVLVNYLILLYCVVGFPGGGMIILMLPVLQIFLSCFNYNHSNKWQTVLMLEIHLLVSTVLGIYLEGYLYLKYISDDAESVLLLREFIRIGAVLVLCMGIITTVIKYISIRMSERKGLKE